MCKILGLFDEKVQIKPDRLLVDYDFHMLSVKDRIFYILTAAAAVFITGYIFYHSILFSILLCPAALFYPNIKNKEIISKRKKDLNLQFKDMLYSLSSSLSAGKSVESAFREVLKDLAVIYPDPDTDIILEMECLVRRFDMNESVESALADFARRSHLEDVENFADVFQTCKRTGGNLVEVIRNSSRMINDKIEIGQEIDTLLSARRFEQKLLNVIPLLMIMLLSLSAADYMEPVFNTFQGRAAMTVSIILLMGAFFISKRIMDIEV